MPIVRHRLVLALLPLLLSAVAAKAQSAYPSKPVQIIADSSAGSAPDVGLRFFTDRLSQIWGQQILVVNRPGAGGSVAARAAAEAAPDGYTLYQPVLSTFVSLRPAAPNVPLHLPKDFLPIGFVTENPMFIAVNPALGINSLKELLDSAKEKPGAFSYATTGVGRLTHLTGELLQHKTGVKLLLVPYTGGPAHAFADVASGRVNMIIEGYSGIAAAARGGKIKLLAVASGKRLPEFPDLPTVSETIPGFEATGWAVMVAPVGTPQAIIEKVSADLRKVAAEPELQKKLSALGAFTKSMTPAQTGEFVQKQQSMWQPVLNEIAKQQKAKN